MENYNVVGVMSGTSLDGVDLAHVKFSFPEGSCSFELLECETVQYSDDWSARLREAITLSPSGLSEINSEYTRLLGGMILNFIDKHNIKEIDAVCSHGHTILHQPQNGLTLQIGNLAAIASITKQKVVCDFRVQDVQLGGQGAPLVPIGDRILFSDYNYCLNLGGFSNISFESGGSRVAFDISPVNTVLNHYSDMLGLDFDDKGTIAASGRVDEELLEKLNGIAFYHKTPPKSLGLEFVKSTILPMIDNFDIPIEDILATFCEHIAVQVAAALPSNDGKMLVTGGGAYNDFLISRMRDLMHGVSLEMPSKKIIEFKEALIFALLGVLKLRGQVNVLSSVTGASHDHSSGKIYV